MKGLDEISNAKRDKNLKAAMGITPFKAYEGFWRKKLLRNLKSLNQANIYERVF